MAARERLAYVSIQQSFTFTFSALMLPLKPIVTVFRRLHTTALGALWARFGFRGLGSCGSWDRILVGWEHFPLPAYLYCSLSLV
jgi:hypothetical protein